MPNIIHRIGIKASPAQLCAAVSTRDGVAGWWTRETFRDTTAGEAMRVHFRDPSGNEIGRMAFLIQIPQLHEEVQWRFTEGPEEWVGTDVSFRFMRDGDTTIVVFAHRNWREAGEFAAHCSMKWATFLLSLRQWVETGQGRPAPDDLKIDNWN